MMTDRGGDAALAVSGLQHTTGDVDAPTATLSGEDVVAMAGGRAVFHVDLPGGTTFHRVIFDLLTRFKVADVKKLLQEATLRESPQFKRTVVVLVLHDMPNAAIVKGIMVAANVGRQAAQAAQAAQAVPVDGGAAGGARARGAGVAAAPTASSEIDVQIFTVNELLVDVTKHMYVPLHEPVRDDAAIARILRTYKVTSKNLPQIMTTDRIARHLALRHGELVRITRPSPSAGTYIDYRCCTRAA